jgi:alpha-galactosidase
MPKISSFAELGLYYVYGSFHYENIGNQSTTEYLPLGIIEHRESGRYLGFQIESYAGWRYELSVRGGRYCLQLGGANSTYHDWKKTLKSGQEYTSVSACICLGGTVNEVAAELTRYRRHLRPKSKADEALPAIYNEYMHYSWDNPFASVTALTAPAVAESGCKYYVIDCGWQAGVAPKNATDEEVTDIVYRLFGTWQENRERFPDGIMKTAELVRSLGMKFGLWIAPEVVGVNNKEMLEYYGDECFFKRNGEKIRHWSGYLLDFRHPRVYKYMSDSLSRMIEDYGCDYIKFDGCPKSGLGTETDGESLGDALEKAMDAFLSWVGDMMKKYPDVIFEDCAGGGQRTDYKALSMFHLLSTSDQMRYDHYPYIVGNVFCAVLPEQAGIWSYPVDSALFETEHPENTDGRVSAERVVINMVNAILGRIHLASRIHLLSSEKQALIKEGVEYYDSITSDKLSAVPYLPKGYTEFGDTFVSCGIKTDKKLYLAVWNLQGKRNVALDLPEIEPRSVRVAYPSAPMGDFSVDLNGNTLDISFGCDEQARIIEIEL